MRRLHPPRPERDRAVINRVHAKPLESFDRPYDVEHGIDGPDLVQVHPFGRRVVYAPFGFADEPECPHRPLARPRRNRRRFDEPDQLTDMAAVRLVGYREFHLLACDPGAPGVTNRNLYPAEPESLGQLAQPRFRYPERQQGAERHVAADASEGIDYGD